MNRQALDLTGRWDGSFSYPWGFGTTTPFLAEIVETGGSLSGSVVEPDLAYRSGETMEALLAGHHVGTSVDFTKTYRGNRFGYENPVDYGGTVSQDGLQIEGVWSLLDLDGTFEMHRDAAAAVQEEKSVEERLPQLAELP